MRHATPARYSGWVRLDQGLFPHPARPQDGAGSDQAGSQ
jgi:hypothetical protein